MPVLYALNAVLSGESALRRNVYLSMRRLYRPIALLPLMLIILLLGGCEISAMEVDNFMRPPAATGDSAAIQQTLTAELGTQYSLRYPRSGEHRSAVVMSNIDNDELEEAIVFYRLSTDNFGARMIVLDRDENGEWHTAGIAEAADGEIDRIMLGDINGNGSNELITGWSTRSGSKLVKAYTIVSGELSSVEIVSNEFYPTNEYSEMVLGDFDGDNRDELVIVYRNFNDGSTAACLLQLQYNLSGNLQLVPLGTAALDSAVYNYINAQAGYFSYSDYGMILDGLRSDGKYISEVVYWDKESQQLIAPTNDINTSRAVTFIRSAPTVSQDIDGDGIIEIPRDKLLPGYTESSEKPLYLTSWFKLTDAGVRLVFQAIMRNDHGYFLTFEPGWDGSVTAQPDQNAAIMYFYHTDEDDDMPFSNELFRIKIFTLDEWKNRSKDSEDNSETVEDNTQPHDYTMLAQTDYYIYAVLISDPENSGISASSLSSQFHLIS